MNEQERKLVDAAKKLLDQSTADLDRETLTRLTRARNRALARQTEFEKAPVV